MTSIEWLENELKNKYGLFTSLYPEFQQAKEMHKQEVEQAYYDGGDEMCPNGVVGGKQAEKYYNETFKSQKI